VSALKMICALVSRFHSAVLAANRSCHKLSSISRTSSEISSEIGFAKVGPKIQPDSSDTPSFVAFSTMRSPTFSAAAASGSHPFCAILTMRDGNALPG